MADEDIMATQSKLRLGLGEIQDLERLSGRGEGGRKDGIGGEGAEGEVGDKGGGGGGGESCLINHVFQHSIHH